MIRGINSEKIEAAIEGRGTKQTHQSVTENEFDTKTLPLKLVKYQLDWALIEEYKSRPTTIEKWEAGRAISVRQSYFESISEASTNEVKLMFVNQADCIGRGLLSLLKEESDYSNTCSWFFYLDESNIRVNVLDLGPQDVFSVCHKSVMIKKDAIYVIDLKGSKGTQKEICQHWLPIPFR